ncbi:Hypothetical protein NTJ_06148 [Nesidiocoris tenuis]|uniref:Uncharacterized protein n=1 Tax=Nesidiocoris tenuis TaxID=355587 RepID=A0ABN7AN15_9HEMI|nr:Hypothetical protein NTJ_06148 [Nesidiocoris tenuis]
MKGCLLKVQHFPSITFFPHMTENWELKIGLLGSSVPVSFLGWNDGVNEAISSNAAGELLERSFTLFHLQFDKGLSYHTANLTFIRSAVY